MKHSVVIKGNRSGMTVFLNPDIPFTELLEAVGRKFRESAKFWGSVQMTLTFEGREISAREEYELVNVITENSHIDVLCLIDTNANRIERCEKALNEKLMELTAQTGQFYRGTLKGGETLESEASVVVIGDINVGAKVIAKGNVIVLGKLSGTAYAGASGNPQTVIAAMEMQPMQLRICDATIRHGRDRSRKLGHGPMVARLEDGEIKLQAFKKPFLNFF
ncbi:MAG: septum site-determining protein MinC [bacterium]|nr:septum site-determining protein MinC [bacterium]